MGSKLIILIMFVLCVSLVNASVTIIAPLAKPANPVITISGGGELTANTTYYYRIMALNKTVVSIRNSFYGSSIWGLPSDEVSAITTDDNKTINISWDVVPNASAYIVYRTEVSGDYDATTAHYVPSDLREDMYPSTTTNFFSDDNIHYESPALQKAFFFEDGIPLIVISGSTEGSPDTEEDIYDALIAGGYTNHTSRVGDTLGRYFQYYIRGNMDVYGWWKIQKGVSVYHMGTVRLYNNAGWLMGEKSGENPYRGTTYSRNFVYEVFYNSASSTIKWYDSIIKDQAVEYSYSQTTTYTGAMQWKNDVTIENCIISNPSFQIDGTATGSIIDTIFSDCAWFMPSSGKMFMSGVQVTMSSYGIYCYYATENPVLKNTIIKGVSYDIYYHKSSTAVNSDVINHQWQNDPPTARAGTRPENLNVRRKYEFELKIIDEDGDAISDATVFIVDGLDNNITPEVSDENGQVWITSGNATSGGDNTLTDTDKSWEINALNDLIVEIVDGTGSGQERSISSNTADTITNKGDWETNPDETSKYRLKIHVMTHSYLGKAESPYYDATAYNPFKIEITHDDYHTNTFNLTIDKLTDMAVKLDEKPAWNYSKAPLWKILNKSKVTVFKISDEGNLAIAGELYENTNSPAPDTILWNIYNLIWLTKSGDLYIAGKRVW